MEWRDFRDKVGGIVAPPWVRNARALLAKRIKENGYLPLPSTDESYDQTDIEVRARLGDPNSERTIASFLSSWGKPMRTWEYWTVDKTDKERGVVAVVLFVKEGSDWRVRSVVTAEARR